MLPRLSLDSYSSTPGEGDSFFSLEDSCDSPSSGDLSSRDRHAHSSDLASQAPPSTVFREGMVTRQQRSDSDSSTGSGFGAGHPQWEVGNTFSIRQDMIWDEGNRSDSERPLSRPLLPRDESHPHPAHAAIPLRRVVTQDTAAYSPSPDSSSLGTPSSYSPSGPHSP